MAIDNTLTGRYNIKNGALDSKEFDVLLYFTEVTSHSVIREFEHLPLRVAICLDASKKGLSPTMLPIIECSLSLIRLATVKTRLIVNLSEDSLSTATSIIEACIETITNYIDCCTNLEIIRYVFRTFTQPLAIKIVQGCGSIPFLIDLGIFSIGKIHEVRDISCTIVHNTFDCAMISHENSALDSLRYSHEARSWEILIGGEVDYLLSKSRRFLRRRGMPHASSTVYAATGNVLLFAIFYVLVSLYFVIMKKRFHRSFINNFKIILDGKKTRMIISSQNPNVPWICLAQTAAVLSGDGVSETGVLTPVMALHESQIIDILAYGNIKFEYK